MKGFYAAVGATLLVMAGIATFVFMDFFTDPKDPQHAALAVLGVSASVPAEREFASSSVERAVQEVTDAFKAYQSEALEIEARKAAALASDGIVRAGAIEGVGRSSFYRVEEERSYVLVRRYLEDGRMPPPEAVRIDEMVNEFSYGDLPIGEEPVSVRVELGDCPWNNRRKLAMIAVQAKKAGSGGGESSNFVIMAGEGPVDAELLALVDQLRARHSVTVVTGSGGLAAARAHFASDAKNRVILSKAAFGKAAAERLLAQGQAEGVAVSVVDLSSAAEARKVLASKEGARDVKIDVRFNPDRVKSYRLIGYEERKPNRQGLTDEGKDLGDMEEGRSIRALYEIEPVSDPKIARQPVEEVREDWVTVKVQYRAPEGGPVRLIARSVTGGRGTKPSVDLEFASAVAEFGLLLQGSPYKGSASYDAAKARAKRSAAGDGLRAELPGLVERARILDSNNK